MFLSSVASIPQFQSLSLTAPFFHGSTSRNPLLKPSTASPPPPRTFLPVIQAKKIVVGKVVKTACDKTVAVEVVRLYKHPKYHTRIRVKKKYQAHDPLNQFKVGDMVELQKSRPISKTKSHIAIPAPVQVRNPPKRKDKSQEQELGIPLESEQPAEQTPVS